MEAELEVLEERLRGTNSRPLLDGANLSAGLRDLLVRRKKQYARLPNHIDTSNSSPVEIAERIIGIYHQVLKTDSDNR